MQSTGKADARQGYNVTGADKRVKFGTRRSQSADREQNRGTDNLALAETLVNEEFLETCRNTGTSRLNPLGLSKQVSDSRLPSMRTAGTARHQSWLTETAPGMKGMENPHLAKQPVLGNTQDDGESVASFCSRLSLQGVKSDTSESKREKKIKSGMYDKVADDVIVKLKWPHKRLSKVWVPDRVQPNQLTFEQVVAGEIAIILRSTDPDEVRGRLHILQKLAYWNMQAQGWHRVRDIYMAILHSIEEGEASFSSSFAEYDQVFPVKGLGKTKNTTAKRDGTFWCRDYNKGSCQLESGHKAQVAGAERVVQHICVNCWKNGRREKHREAECPHKEL